MTKGEGRVTVVKLKRNSQHGNPRFFPFVTPTALLQLVVEKDQYNIAASNADAAYDLWAFWHDNRLKMPAWYSVAKDVALIQPPSAFMERVFSILRACMNERQEQCYSDRIAASALLNYNRRAVK